VPSGADRYRFRSWSWTGGGAGIPGVTSANIGMAGPTTATADYALQHQISFDQTGIPSGVPWNVTVRSVEHSGPYSEWFDERGIFGEFTTVDFSFQDPVPGPTTGTCYKLVSVNAVSPLSDLSLLYERPPRCHRGQR
jgi:hypothetical protein